MARPLVFVHGFNYDHHKPNQHHPEHHLYPRWRKMLGRTYDNVMPFFWFSRPNPLDAWVHGRWNRYRYAWDLAEKATDRLRILLVNVGEPVDIVCHSLGSRVVLLALGSAPPSTARHVLILNGAAYSRSGETVAKACPETRFYNVVVPADDVISKLARFAPGPGTDFLGNTGAPEASNWTNVDLKGGGDNPDSVGDHHYSYENEANWHVYRAIFSVTLFNLLPT